MFVTSNEAAAPAGPVVDSAPTAPPVAAVDPAGLEEQPAAAREDDDQPAVDGEQPPPIDQRPRGVQKRLDELTRRANDAQRVNDRLIGLLERQALQNGSAPQLEKPRSGPPQRSDFESFEDYLDAKTQFRADEIVAQRLGQIEQRTQQARQHQAIEQREDAWEQRSDAAVTKYADYEEVVHSDSLAISDVMMAAIKDCDAGPDVAYYLGKHPNEAARIYQLNPVAQVRAIGSIEARLTKQPIRQASKTPAPIEPVSGGRSTASGNLDNASQAEYEAQRAKDGAWWGRK